MQFKNPYVNKFWKFSTSFQLGIPILVVLTGLIMWGTIVESVYNDANAAQKLVYRSPAMYITMALLIYNLVIVMVDRWPWKKRHAPFILVHIGIITMIMGGWVTQKFGLDGSMAIPINGKNNFVQTGETDLVIYATFDGDSYRKMFEKEVDFFINPPTEEHPLRIPLGEKELVIKKYLRYARVNKKLLVSTDDNAGASIKFQLQNANVTQVETLTQANKNKFADVNLGPLKIFFGFDAEKSGRKNKAINEMYLNPVSETEVRYSLFKKEEDHSFKSGKLKIGEVLATGWMGLELRLIDYLPKATEEWEAQNVEVSTPLTTAAVQIQFGEKTQWLLLNDIVKLFGQNSAYLVSYQNRRLDLGFPVYLKNFEKTNYEGTQKAKTYASEVKIEATGRASIEGKIEMNEPIKFAGYTFYQASFNQDEKTGEISASILSVNFDPGRWIKYLGSLILTSGILWLFIQSRKRKTAA